MLFIKAFAESAGAKTAKGRINSLTGVSRRGNPQSAFYRRTGTSGMGGNARTRGRQAPIREVTRGR